MNVLPAFLSKRRMGKSFENAIHRPQRGEVTAIDVMNCKTDGVAPYYHCK